MPEFMWQICTQGTRTEHCEPGNHLAGCRNVCTSCGKRELHYNTESRRTGVCALCRLDRAIATMTGDIPSA